MSDTATNHKAETPSIARWADFPINLGWRNVVYALRLSVVGIFALALSYWLELDQPKWTVVTTFLITQTIAGAALAKAAYRFLGTFIAAVAALVIVALFSQDPILLVGATAFWMFWCYYAATKARNLTVYIFQLAGFTTLMITFDGAATPDQAWVTAVARFSEISLGIACATIGCMLVFPVYAADELRTSLGKTFRNLTGYVAVALKPSTAPQDFMALRRDILAQVTSFDALRSYTVFESRDDRAYDAPLRAAVAELLRVLAEARGLYFRISSYREEGVEDVLSRLEPALAQTVDMLEKMAAAPDLFEDIPALRSRITTARRKLTALAHEFETMSDGVPLLELANAALILRRTAEMLRSLTLVLFAERAAFDPRYAHKRRPQPVNAAHLRAKHHEAVMQGARVALGVVLFCTFWYATELDMGALGVVGFSIMSYMYVGNDNPNAINGTVFILTFIGCVLNYLVMTFVYPWLDGFTMLAAFLFLVMMPVSLCMGTPRFSMAASLLIGLYIAVGITANVYQPNSLELANLSLAILLGMGCCLIVAWLLPVTSRGARKEAYHRTLCELLPEAALGTRPGRHCAKDIISLLASLLPRLKPGQGADETLLRGMLSNASTAVELGRLRSFSQNPALAEPARKAIADGLNRLAEIMASLPEWSSERDIALGEAHSTLNAIWNVLKQLEVKPGTENARLLLDSAASLRFLADRLKLDREFLDLSFSG